MGQGRPSDRQLDRLERMLERCIEEQKASRRGTGTRPDPFYEKLKILREAQEKLSEEIRSFKRDNDRPKH